MGSVDSQILKSHLIPGGDNYNGIVPNSISTMVGVNVNSGISVVPENVELTELSEARRTVIEDVMIELGYPVISLYITQRQINQMIDFSVRKCANKACPRFLATFYSTGCVDVSDYDMETVSFVYEGDIASASSSNNLVVDENGCGGCDSSDMGCSICDKLCQYRGYSMGLMQGDWNNQLYDLIAWRNAKAQMNSMQLSDWYLDHQGQKLYLDNFNGLITVEYTKSHITFEDLDHDTMWQGWVRDYTLALCKVIEGRIRAKFKVSSAPFEIEADELINEGNQQKELLDEQLREDIGYWNILRS